ncbi:MAG: FkbM family methyltransferase [Nitrospinae bacterium]|nr:FkbM family methyltransferase [Nitrospinota bacterium]
MRIPKKIKRWIYKISPWITGSFPYYGTWVYFPKGCHLFNRFLEQGEYESENVMLLLNFIKKGSVVFDIGANIGLISIRFLNEFKECTVVSFEPSPNNIPFLERTWKNSGFGNRWNLVFSAAGEKTGNMDFYIASPAMGAFDGFRDTKRAGSRKKISIPVTTVDNEWKKMGRPKVSVIKIDVEGAEMQVLKGATYCIECERPYILSEWNSLNFSVYDCVSSDLIRWAEENKYKIFRTLGLIPVLGSTDLKVQMTVTENFLLAPSDV